MPSMERHGRFDITASYASGKTASPEVADAVEWRRADHSVGQRELGLGLRFLVVTRKELQFPIAPCPNRRCGGMPSIIASIPQAELIAETLAQLERTALQPKQPEPGNSL